jgi:SAM-dependent methyltransferase
VKHPHLETLKNCPVCDSSELTDYMQVKDFSVSKEEFQIKRCNACGLLFTNPRPAENEIGKYYESEEYISHSNSNKGLFAKIYQSVRNRTVRDKRELIQSHSDVKGKILDYGCGTGEFLNEMQQNGWESTGLEPNEKAAAQATENYNLQIKHPNELSKLESKTFKAITLWHVLEHVHELKTTLKLLRQILSDDGIMAIAVPNSASWDAKYYGKYWAAYDVPRHLYHFSPPAMGKLLSNTGFTLKEIVPMKWDSYYVSLLSEKYKGNMIGPAAAFFTGTKTNILGKGNVNKYSSLIYLVEKSLP